MTSCHRYLRGRPLTLAKEMYKTDEPVKTFYTANVVVIQKKLDQDLVYRVTKALFENIEKIRQSHPSCQELDLDSAVEGMPIAYHPGALKYFAEKGLKPK